MMERMTRMSRAFLYMVTERYRPPLQSVYMVHRINTSRLFFSNKDDQRPQAPEAAEVKARLPPPTLSLYSSVQYPDMEFVLFGRNRDKIVAMGYHSRAVLYDDALRAVSALPSMKELKCFSFHPVSLAVGDHLFVMNNPPLCYVSTTSMEALVDREAPWLVSDLFWQSITPPPYGKPEYDDPAVSGQSSVQAYTVVGGSQVWISTEGHGTYSLEMKNFCYDLEGNNKTRRGEWSKVGDWALPFSGPAVYAPELKLWFGLSEEDKSVLCAVDLQQGATHPPPVVRHKWEGFTVPRGHYISHVDSSLVHLGSGGRFCMAIFSCDESGRDTAMLTGMEVMSGEPLRLVKHKTCRYTGFGDDLPVCLL